ncbi:lysis system i-spanin subunit Rz [Pseudomonas extremorientalis]|uniref:Bacteriophage Rz lysis protein n=1 Tax=Pseudomonas extremorientalis TaxID=169669 RepID=A0ABY0RZA3_9PSED|nr:lysis system i-spanin subunit Rz [Pseudomonas extremorientalis]KAB0517552.1 lysis protein [Pseudomonas extremorientalis]SDO59461.1 Bacteriophage Rz lysis protein [Pseudomonas extremorientalis]
MTPGQILAAILLAVSIGFGAAWQVQYWRMGERLAVQAGLHRDDLAAISNAATAQVRTLQEKRLVTEQKLAIQDQLHIKELSDAQRNQARLRDQLATADVRLSVLLTEDPASSCNVPATAGAVSVVHAARRAQLDPAHAQRIIGITDSGDRGLIALRACQAYVRVLSGNRLRGDSASEPPMPHESGQQ